MRHGPLVVNSYKYALNVKIPSNTELHLKPESYSLMIAATARSQDEALPLRNRYLKHRGALYGKCFNGIGDSYGTITVSKERKDCIMHLHALPRPPSCIATTSRPEPYFIWKEIVGPRPSKGDDHALQKASIIGCSVKSSEADKDSPATSPHYLVAA